MHKNSSNFLVRTCLATIFCLLSVANLWAEEATNVENLIPRLQPAVVLIQSHIMLNEANINGNVLPFKKESVITGTGFIIQQNGYIVTNGHVVKDYHEANNKPLTYGERTNILDQLIKRYSDVRKLCQGQYDQCLEKVVVRMKKELFVLLSTGVKYAAEVKSYSPPIETSPGKEFTSREEDKSSEAGKDVAIIKIEGRNLPIVKLGDSESLRKGEPLYVFGYPGVVSQNTYLSEITALDATVNHGSVSGIKVDTGGDPIIQTDAQITHGNSGGPAFNSKGEVVGVATLGSVSNTGEIVQGFNFLVPVNTVKEFVRTAGLPVDADSLFNRVWYQALDLDKQGKSEESLAKCDEALRLLPNQPDVSRLRRTLQEKILVNDPTPLRTSTVVAAAAAALLAAVGFYLFRRGKGPQAARGPSAAAMTGAAHPEHLGSLTCKEGSQSGKCYPIGATGLKIGRDPHSNQIVIDGNEISREHAWVGIEGGKMLLKDLDSLNGTYLNSTNGERTKSAVLKGGDLIIIGKGRFASFTYNSIQ